jgi:hypothetical protein
MLPQLAIKGVWSPHTPDASAVLVGLHSHGVPLAHKPGVYCTHGGNPQCPDHPLVTSKGTISPFASGAGHHRALRHYQGLLRRPQHGTSNDGRVATTLTEHTPCRQLQADGWRRRCQVQGSGSISRPHSCMFQMHDRTCGCSRRMLAHAVMHDRRLELTAACGACSAARCVSGSQQALVCLQGWGPAGGAGRQVLRAATREMYNQCSCIDGCTSVL